MNIASSPGVDIYGRPKPRDPRLILEQANRHPGPRQLEHLMRGELTRLEVLAVVRHLLAGCPMCAEVTRRMWQLGERMSRRGPARPTR